MVSLLSNDFWQHGISSNRAVICLFVGSKNSPKRSARGRLGSKGGSLESYRQIVSGNARRAVDVGRKAASEKAVLQFQREVGHFARSDSFRRRRSLFLSPRPAGPRRPAAAGGRKAGEAGGAGGGAGGWQVTTAHGTRW